MDVKLEQWSGYLFRRTRWIVVRKDLKVQPVEKKARILKAAEQLDNPQNRRYHGNQN